MSRAIRANGVMAAFGVGGALLLGAPRGWERVAIADEGAAPGAYEVPAECPRRHAWLEGVRARLAPLLRTHPALDTLSVRVELDAGAEPRRYTGTLGSREPRPMASPRSVHGSSCEEVLDALTFIAALGLQRLASDVPPTSNTPESPAPPVAPGTREDHDEGAASTPAVSRARLGAMAFALADDGVAPGNGFGVGAAFRVSWPTPHWQPLIMLGAYRAGARESALGTGRVRLGHWSTHVIGCPWRFPRESSVGLRPCVELDVGRSTGKGSGVESAATRSAPWLSTGVQLRVEVELWHRLELGSFVGVVKPLWHAHFLLEPGVTAFETPAIGLRAGGSAAVLF